MKKKMFFLIVLLFCLSGILPAAAQQSEKAAIPNFISKAMEYRSISEAQSASDLAAHFGFAVTPLEIMAEIPLTDNPNTGYVGHYDDKPSLPPETYGVYQTPLAEALVKLNIPAHGFEGQTTDDLKEFLRSGYPVICWVIGHTAPGEGIDYTSEDGENTVVAHQMNTVTVTGFDHNGFSIWDNGVNYTRTEIDFNTSWKVLGHRALIIRGQASVTDMAQWWDRSPENWWKEEPAETQPETPAVVESGRSPILLQNLPRETTIESLLGGQNNTAADPFASVPEVVPDFDPNSIPNPEDYLGWFWYPEDQSQTDLGNTFPSYSGAFGNIAQGWTTDMLPPDSASIDGFVGYPQSFNLDCETRSAVDLAAFFGFKINAKEFLTTLPKSDDPNEGFVGNYWDQRGQLPPAGYGVYQEPIANQLRKYGFPAVGYKNMSWEQVQYEIANRRPVMVWVAGATEMGTPIAYTPASGRTTYVVPFQHTVVVLGYDAQNVILQDGGIRYTRSLNTFLASWAVLENRGIVAAYNGM